MSESDAIPEASRPYAPGYQILDAQSGHGLLPWSWGPSHAVRPRVAFGFIEHAGQFASTATRWRFSTP